MAKTLILLFAALALTFSLSACGRNPDADTDHSGGEVAQSSPASAGSENTTPAPDPSPENSEQLSSDDPTPTSDELPSGYLNSDETIIYHIYGQPGQPGDIIAEFETDFTSYTYFIPNSDELTQLLAGYNFNYFCRYNPTSDGHGEECYLYIYDDYAEIVYSPASHSIMERTYSNNLGIAYQRNGRYDPPECTVLIYAFSQDKGDATLLWESSQDVIVDFSKSTIVLGDERLSIIEDALDSYMQ